MGEFIDVALGFPTALFTFPLIVVAGYWVLVAVGLDVLDADTGAGAGDALAAARLGGAPVIVALSSLVVVAWFASLAGSALGVPGAVTLPAALAASWLATAALVRAFRRFVPAGWAGAGDSRRDLVGRMCVIRTGRVGADFGQAEVAADDGTSALVQVRVPDSDLAVAGRAEPAALTLGSPALIFDYDAAGEFFWVMPYDAPPDPG
ncbi:hypothetical protein [Spirillospora sp. NPDC029432]|uniref:hypothetical protein n=1 Tax=Spirillospora sp. NPDC029432 TaxID=3154599 RepID=UPI00345543F6